MQTERKKILLFTNWYEPGYRAGGPIRSCVNFVAQMKKEYEIYVFTGDRDLGSDSSYAGIKTDEWLLIQDGVHVFYCSPGKLTWKNIRRQWLFVNPAFVYLNSMFSPKFTIYPLLISRLNKLQAKIILSPRGMLRESAIRFKFMKKKFFLEIFRRMHFHRDIYFHASDITEAGNISQYFGSSAQVATIPNFPAALPTYSQHIPKRKGELSMIFIGRVHPIKNLDFLLKLLNDVKAKVQLTIIGSLEDKAYWEKCLEIIAVLPGNIAVKYEGERPNDQLAAFISSHHIFVLPTQGENFGHAIFEALALGKPVLISDQTPWRALQVRKAGWDLSLWNPGLFVDVIKAASGFDQETYNEWCSCTLQYIKEYTGKLNIKEAYLKLFN